MDGLYVYNGKPLLKCDDLGVPLNFGNTQIDPLPSLQNQNGKQVTAND